MEFLGDQGRDVVIVRDFLKNGNLFFIGPQTSIGNMYLGPYYYYFIAPSLLLALYNPVGPAIFVALLSVLTTALIYKISQKWFNLTTALVSSLLFAISPVVIKYSSFSWNPNIMPLFALLFIYFFSQSVIHHRHKNLIWACLSLIMVLNSHYLGLLLLPPAALYWLIYFFKNPSRRKIFIKFSLIAFLIFLLSLIPQLLFDLKHQGQNIKALLSFFTQRETTVNLKAYKAIPNLFPLFTQIVSRLLTGKNVIFGFYFSLAFIITFVIYLYRLTKKINKTNPYVNLLLLWLISGLVGLALYKQHIYDHYFAFLFPPFFILTGLILANLRKIISLPLFLLLIFLSISQNPFLFSPPRQLQTVNTITDSIIEKSQSDTFNLALLAKQNYDPPYRYSLFEKNAPLFDLHDQLTEQLFVICEPHPDIDCQPINNPEWGIAAFGWAKIDQEWQVNGIKVFRLIHNPEGKAI
jgi:4-amino-4-deoxy-L-arabinose transferase-like glycosyltransferase